MADDSLLCCQNTANALKQKPPEALCEVCCGMSALSYHHDVCAEGLSKSHTHNLIVKPCSACRCSSLLRAIQFQRFRQVLHYFLSSCSPSCADCGLRLSFADGFVRSLPCDQSPHLSLSPVPSSPLLLSTYCLCLSFQLGHINPSPPSANAAYYLRTLQGQIFTR